MDKLLAIWIFVAIMGAALIGKGATGYLIASQSCCLSGDKCPVEQRCENVGFDYGQYEFRSDIMPAIIGLTLTIISLIAIRKRIHLEGIN